MEVNRQEKLLAFDHSLALGAEEHPDSFAVDHHFVGVEIRFADLLSPVFGMTDVVTNISLFAANFTNVCHRQVILTGRPLEIN
jgi:hypothetical protein